MSLFGISLLIIEDDPAVAGVFELALQQRQPEGWALKYRIKRVETLAEAKRQLGRGSQDKYDVILLDLSLPDSRGVDTFRAIYSVAKAPIIVLSGAMSLDDMQQMLREGAHRCFEKTLISSNFIWLHYAIVACIEAYRLKSQVERLQETLLNELKNMITACSNCHKWRNAASNEYMPPEQFLEKYGVFLSHGICPDCAKLRYPEFAGE